jgi:hypothetical protein
LLVAVFGAAPLRAEEPPAPLPSRTLYFQKPPELGVTGNQAAQALQAPKKAAKLPAEGMDMQNDLLRFQIRLEPPGPELVFRRESEAAVEQRMRQETRQQNLLDNVVFPEKPGLSKVAFTGRSLAPQVIYAEPNYVNYGRLYFEEKNSERYAWDLGVLQPLVSTLYFYKDTLLWPHNAVSYPHRRYETSAGQCLPGDPVPYIIYPPVWTIEGVLAELGVGTALFVVFP